MPVLVLGASSQIGHFLLPRLHREGIAALAVGRRGGAPHAGVDWRVGALPDAMPVLPALDGIACYGPIDALAAWLSSLDAAPAPVLVATSSMSVLSKQDSPVDAERAIVARLRAGEDGLRRECTRLGMRWTILRPTLVWGAGLDRSLTPIARRARRWRVFPLPAARGWRQPVHADDVADATLRALRTPAADGRVLALGGGERLRAAEMFARVRRSLGTATLPLPLGTPVLAAMAALLPQARGPVSRLHGDLVADNSDATAVLGIAPRGFTPTAAAWRFDDAAGRGA